MIENPAIDPLVGTLEFLTGSKILELFLSNFIDLGIKFAGAACLIYILVGGISYVASAGDKESAQKAAKTVTSAIVGLAIVLSIFAIITIVELLFGIDIVSFTIPTI